MKYQLIHHDGQGQWDHVSQSPDLPNEAAVTGWYNFEISGKQLPAGRQWAMIDENHEWYRRDNQTAETNQSNQQSLQQYGQKAEGHETIAPQDEHFALNKSDTTVQENVQSAPKPDSKELPQDEASALARQHEQDAKREAEIEANRKPNPTVGNGTNLNVGLHNPPFSEVMQDLQKSWNKEREEKAHERQALATVLRNFGKRK